MTQSKITSDYIVRYFNSWFETLNQEEKTLEDEYCIKYKEFMENEGKVDKDCCKASHKKSVGLKSAQSSLRQNSMNLHGFRK